MAAIGSLAIHAWRGTPQGETKAVEVIRRPGVDGTGLLVGEYQSRQSIVETEYYSSFANVQIWEAAALLLVGTSVSVTDGNGATWSDTVILDIQYSIRAVKGLGASTHIISARWVMAMDY